MKYLVCVCLLSCVSSVLSADCETEQLEITREGNPSHNVILGMGLAEGTSRETNSGVVFRCSRKQLRACLNKKDDDDDCFKVDDCKVLTVYDTEIKCGHSDRNKRSLPSAVHKSKGNFLSKRRTDRN